MTDFKPKWPSRLTGKALAASLLIAFGVLQAPGIHAQPALPTLGDGLELTTSAERRIGDSIIRELYRDPDYVDDPVLQEYVQGIFQSLVVAARARGELSPELEERFAWEILLGRDRTVNAFALPGGYMGVHLGLIGVVASRDELASVMAHELSHVTQRHIARLMAQQQRTTPLMIGAMVLGALAASKSPNAGQALMVGGQALAVQNQLNFSRDMEREADRMGYGLMAPAGFAPEGFVSMFDKLQQANRLNDNGSWPYLRSHPLTTERMADMHARLPAGQASLSLPVATLEHAMLAARARVLSRPGIDLLRQWAAEPASTGFAAQPLPKRVAAWYAAALSQAQLRDWAGARRMLEPLRQAVQGCARRGCWPPKSSYRRASPRLPCSTCLQRVARGPSWPCAARRWCAWAAAAMPPAPWKPGWPRTRKTPRCGSCWPVPGSSRDSRYAPCAPRPRRVRRITTTRRR